MNELLQRLTVEHPIAARATDTFEPRSLEWLDAAEPLEFQQFWLGVEQLHDAGQFDSARFDQLLRELQTRTALDPLRWQSDEVLRVIEHLYRTWTERSTPRHRLLILLLQRTGEAGWRLFAELIATDPPRDDTTSVEAFLPLWKRSEGPFHALFPRLLDAVQHRSVAPIVLDLANYLFRSRRLAVHPASARAGDLTWLLGQLVERLEEFEQSSRQQGVRDLQLAQHVQESITLAIALCHTLSLVQHREAIGKWYRILDLQHRRLRVEAAAALAKVGEPSGLQALGALAAEPLVRLRVHAYAAELGILDQVDAKWRTPQARAESELVLRLAEPDLFGVPPSSWQLIDQRQLAWPGYDEPRACFLFRYTYHLASSNYINVALVGPVAHALMADLTPFSADDVYAVYAGWNTEHDELKRLELNLSDPAEVEHIAQRRVALQAAGIASIEPQFWGQFFGVRLLVAGAQRQSQPGTVVVGDQQFDWFPQGNPVRPLTADLAYNMFIGRQLLTRFNDDYPSATTVG